MLIKRAGLGLLFGIIGIGAYDTVGRNSESAPAAIVHFTDIPTPSVTTRSSDIDLPIMHTPEKYYGASVEERFTTTSEPVINYPVGPGTYVNSLKK